MVAHIWSNRVYYADTDAGGIMHHSAYIRFFEQARTESLRQIGIELPSVWQNYGIIFAIKTINISYIKPAKLDDLLFITTKLKTLAKASLIYEQSMSLQTANSAAICVAETKLACVNAKMQLCRVPKIFKKMEIL